MDCIELADKVLVLPKAIQNTEDLLDKFKKTPIGRGYSRTTIEAFGHGGSDSYPLFVVSDDKPGPTKNIETGLFTPKDDDYFYNDLLKIDTIIWESFYKYIDHYSLHNLIKKPNRLGYSMRHYVPGSFVGPHADYVDGDVPYLSITLNIYLNSDFEGGEICFYSELSDRSLVVDSTEPSTKYRPASGDIVLFPSSMIHRVEPITSGERYNINALFSEPEKPSWYTPEQGAK